MYVHKKSVCTHNPLWYKMANTYTLALWKIYTSVSMYESNRYTLRYFISFTCVFTILILCVQYVCCALHPWDTQRYCVYNMYVAYNHVRILCITCMHYMHISDGVGFEPTVCYAYLSFQDWYLWPLRHPSCVHMCIVCTIVCTLSYLRE